MCGDVGSRTMPILGLWAVAVDTKPAHIDANKTPPKVSVYGHFGGVFILFDVK